VFNLSAASSFFFFFNHEQLRNILFLLPFSYFSSIQLRNYKNILKKLHVLADDKLGLPPDHEWAKPYQNLPVEELRAMAVRRKIASPLGASSATKNDLVRKLAHGDFTEYDHAKFTQWTMR